MTVHPNARNLARDMLRRSWPKMQPRRPRESRQAKRVRDTGPSAAVRGQVRARSRLCCERCGRWCGSAYRAGQIHHRRNRSQGTDNSLPNLTYVCVTCHSWIGAEQKAAHAEGWHLEHGEAPDETELLYYVPQVGHRKVLLCADGSIWPIGGDV